MATVHLTRFGKLEGVVYSTVTCETRSAHDDELTPQAKPRGRLANVAAVEAQANALRHVHFLGHAGVGAATAHFRAIHEVMDGIAEWLIVGGARVERNHLANAHGFSSLSPCNTSLADRVHAA